LNWFQKQTWFQLDVYLTGIGASGSNPPDWESFVGRAYYQGKDVVFRFIIEYSSLRDFGPPPGNNNRSIFI
jgi:hypothetical protein